MYRRGDDQLLFSEDGLDGYVDSLRLNMLNEIDSINEERILGTSLTDLCDYFENNYLIDIPQLREDMVNIDQNERKVDISRGRRGYRVRGDYEGPVIRTMTEVTFFVPGSGDIDLLRYRPSTFTMAPPMATIGSDEIKLTFYMDDTNATALKSEFNDEMQKIKSQVEVMSRDLAGYNIRLKSRAKSALETRKQRILGNRGLVAELGFPLKRNNTTPLTYIAPVSRKKLEVSLTPSATPFAPEPALDMPEYEHILTVINSMSAVMERSPKAFKAMGEEDIRWLFLVPLNGHYEGQATGETFNYEGKTDILIRVKDKNIFVAECKIWDGPDLMAKTIDQILSYTSWRDTKTAILIFNRNKDFSAILKKIDEVASKHPNCKKQLPFNPENGYRYLYHHPNDRNRELTLTILAFDVPK